MKTSPQFPFFLIFLFLAALACGAQSAGKGDGVQPFPGPVFIGVDWTAELSAPSMQHLNTPSFDSISLSFTGGFRDIAPFIPIRLRAGVGWFPGRKFRILPGIELALLEMLNGSGALAFGLYATVEARIQPAGDPYVEPAARLGILLPLGPSGGLYLAAGMDGGGRPTASIGIRNGGYIRADGPDGRVR